MKKYEDFFNEQYAHMEGDESKTLDHPLYRFLLPFAKTRTDVVCKLVGKNSFQSVVELGCGSCEIAEKKLDQFGHYSGLDISLFQLSRTPDAVKNNPKVSLQTYDLNQPLPFKDEAADLVISLSTIEYLFDPIGFVREIYRILAPNGTLILHTMNLAFLPRRLQLLFGQLPTYNSAAGWQGGILHNFTYPTVKQLLKSNRFDIIRIQCAGLIPWLRMAWPNLLASDIIVRCKKKAEPVY